MKAEARRVLLAGPIGSGKSTVGDLLRRRGALVVDADREGHAVLQPDGAAYPAVARRWPSVVHEDRIDRSELARIVFADPAQLAELEELTHPHIRDRIRRAVEEDPAPVTVVQAPLLADLLGEGWWRVVVDAPEEVRRQRLRRRGMDDRDIELRMAAQPGGAEWVAWADYLLDNGGDLEELEAGVEELWNWLQSPEGRPSRSVH